MDELYSLYKKDKKKRYIIEVKVDDVKDLFNSYDPSLLFERDLDKNFVERVLSEVVIFHNHAKLALHIHIPKRFKKKHYEEKIAHSIRHYFSLCAIDAKSHIKNRIKRGFSMFLFGLVIFILSFGLAALIKSFNSTNFVINLLMEGFIIGGWIAMWQPIATLLFEWHPLYKERSQCYKVAEMHVEVKYF